MAEIDIAPNFGAELKDSYKPVNAWVYNGILWLDDIQQFYRERSAIEKEYSAKLNGLARKYFEKKARKSSSLSVGDTPSMTPGSLESASLTTWTTQLSTLESRAAEHDRFSSELLVNIAEPLKQISTRYEELRKRHAEYAVKLEKEKDGSYADLRKNKGSYDAVCQEVENRRKKVESSFDFGKQKAQGAYQQQILDMHNVKNTYLIGVNITNKQKERYYHEYVPDLVDSLQDLSETRTARLNTIWSNAAQIEASILSRSIEQVNYLSKEIPRNNPLLDSMMFVRHNTAAWQEPPDMVFEPSPVWHDDAAMVVDEPAKIFLRNVLGRSKGQVNELKREVDSKRREVEGVKRIRVSIKEGKDKRDEVEVVRAIFAMQEDLHQLDRKRLTAEVEASTIKAAVGDISSGGKNHNFKPQTFKIPTNCDLCGERIWGLSAKGFDCRDCGYTCHSKCELKVPATCPGEQTKEERKQLKAERQTAARPSHPPNGDPTNGARLDVNDGSPTLSRSNTMNSLSSSYAASTHRPVSATGGRTPVEEAVPERSTTVKPSISKPNALRKNRIVAPPPAQYVSESSAGETNGGMTSGSSRPGEQKGTVLYAYDANGADEVSVEQGDGITILEPDDGSGWMRVRVGSSEGIVPAAYVEVLSATRPSFSDRPVSNHSNSSTSLAGSMTAAGKRKGPAVAPRRGAKKLNYVEAMYDYEARSEAEWSMTEGERLVLVNRDAGDGWADVEKGGQIKSVPANYIQDVP
ncbi:MAG: hypothetical protein M1812_004601 [Candelaria pacifica]|nr:MAG: hypothetical protein M1812_004601 [Candelaria pacifica]